MSKIKTLNRKQVASVVNGLIKNPNIMLSVEYNDNMEYKICRTLYYFDQPNSKHEFPEQFDMLNHDARLVQYKKSGKTVWFYADEKGVSGFQIMDKNSQKIFDAVKIALQKQKQNVK